MKPGLAVRLGWAVALGAALTCTAASADPSGHRWFAVPTYVVFPHSGVNGVPSGFASSALPVIRASYRHWTSDEVACTSWQVQYGGTFSSPTGLNAVEGSDRINRMLWLGGTQWRYPSNTLAMTTTTYFTGSGEIFDADMEMNNNVPWKLGGGAASYDVETITTHEAGHFLGLNHSQQPSTVMFPTVSLGSIKTVLDPVDVADVCGVYPSASGGGAGRGSPCTADTQCEGTLVCRGAAGTGSFICTSGCGSGCPQGTTCQAAQTPSGGNAQACLVAPGVPDLCTFCTSGQDCLSGICLTTGRQNYCSSACTGNDQCGAGYECYEQYCAPSGSACPAAQCEGAWHCPQGYACMGGMCTATGKTGDRCEVSLYCEPCSLCIGTYSEAFCRSCCGGSGQGGSCNACNTAGCASGGSCLSLEDESGQPLADQVCVPAGSGACVACSGDGDCMPGLGCISGRCHAACNASASNACDARACGAAPGTSQAVCACTDEVASVGQSCGELGGSLRICGYGAVCVGRPATCRMPCSGGCAANQSCQVVDGQSVCVTERREGGTCGACRADGTCSDGLRCLGGRCFEACTLESSTCVTACVAVEGNTGVCGCVEDQQVAGGPCGLSWDTPYACVAGAVCADGTCRQPCGAGDTCTGEATCEETPAGKACIPPGCGCGAMPAGGWAQLLPVLAWLAARRRGRA